jgi:hypothetical protein
VDAAHDTRPLGGILVDEGLLSPEQLKLALAEQARVGRPLGQVVVDLGLASAPALASALAEQKGGMHRSEYGVSVGFRRDLAGPETPALPPVAAFEQPKRDDRPAWSDPPLTRPAAVPDPPAEEPPVEGPPVEEPAAELVPAAQPIELPVEQPVEEPPAAPVVAVVEALPPPPVAPPAAAPAPAASGHDPVPDLLAAVVSRDSELAQLRTELTQQGEELAQQGEELAKLRGELEGVRGALESSQEQLAEAHRRLEEEQGRRAPLEADVAGLRAENTDLAARLEVATAPPPSRFRDELHRLLVPSGTGYRVVERDGPPPEPDALVELPSDEAEEPSAFVVARRSRLAPGDATALVHLLPL